jgi:hypothetical protein
MFKTLRMKLMLGFLPLLASLIGLGLWAIAMFYGLGGNIDVILRENYRSVLAVERMKEALERMDSGLMFAFSGRARQAREQFDFGVVSTGDLDPGLRLVVHPGGDVRSVGRLPAIAFS